MRFIDRSIYWKTNESTKQKVKCLKFIGIIGKITFSGVILKVVIFWRIPRDVTANYWSYISVREKFEHTFHIISRLYRRKSDLLSTIRYFFHDTCSTPTVPPQNCQFLQDITDRTLSGTENNLYAQWGNKV